MLINLNDKTDLLWIC